MIMTAMRERRPLRADLALLAAVLAVSTGSIFACLAESHPLVTAAYRMGLAVLLVAPLACWRARAELRSLSRREWALAGLSGLCLAFHFATWISSLRYTPVANSVVLVNTVPIWVALLAPWVTQDRIAARTWQSVGVSVAGGVLIGVEDFATGGQALVGDALALAGSLGLAAYVLLGRRLRTRLSLVAYVTVCYGAAAVVLWSVVLACRLPVTGFPIGTWSALLGMALVSQHVGHSGYNYALRFFSASAIAVSLLGEPLLATIWAYFLFHQGLTWVKCCGAALILVGIYLAASERSPGLRTSHA
jgi:drug/metabolite transporter (DMT)-like permease